MRVIHLVVVVDSDDGVMQTFWERGDSWMSVCLLHIYVNMSVWVIRIYAVYVWYIYSGMHMYCISLTYMSVGLLHIYVYMGVWVIRNSVCVIHIYVYYTYTYICITLTLYTYIYITHVYVCIYYTYTWVYV